MFRYMGPRIVHNSEHDKFRFSSICKNLIYSCDTSQCSLKCLVSKYTKYIYDWYNISLMFYQYTYCKMQKLIENEQP